MSTRGRAFALCSGVYLAALLAALLVLFGFGDRPSWLVALVADIVATVVVYGFSQAFRNSSLYDPYWSVAPPLLALFWLGPIVTPREAVVLALVTLWAVRLTWNCLVRWGGLDHEDWRYADLRERWGGQFWWVDLAGIHLMPTLLVFAACLPLLVVARPGTSSWNVLDGVAMVVVLGAIAIEAVADRQLRRFLRTRSDGGTILAQGLWAYSRHPNYFGEIAFWWGLYLFALAADPEAWWAGAGAAAITALFVWVSVPLLDTRSVERRPGYVEHMRRVSAIVPWFRG